ncbi:nuclear protein, partial [Entophlyctis helioformis]
LTQPCQTDGCRVRKRKCDGLQPFCTNCIKSVVRGSDGNPVCTYHTEAKKRGPRPGYKDKMLQRLERLES